LATTGNPLEIRLLGRFEVVRGQALELPPSKKARALLAYLAASGRAHDRGQLATLLWDEREDSRGALRWCLSRLRPLVDDEHTRLNADRDRVAFEPHGAEVDLAAVRAALRDGIDRVPLETLEAAAARFRGELLDGLDLTECYAFHAWCVAEREAARALHTSILSAIVSRLGNEAERALPFARRLLDLDPLAGTAQAAIVRILGVLGRQREAEELYQSFKQLLQSRLGERTSIELERARMELRKAAPAPSPSQSPSVSATAKQSTPTPPPAAGPGLARMARSPFVGRTAELGTLARALDSAVGGQGGFAEVSGEAGVGKSRLLGELVHQARLRGARVLVGRCLEGEGSPAYLPFLESLDTALKEETDLERLVGDDAALAARLFPRLAARLGTPSVAPASSDATSDRYLVFQAVATLLERIAAPAGALLVLEDLHWIDQPSLALLRYLTTRLADMRLLVVGSCRGEDLDPRHPLVAALADLRHHGSTSVLLRGLADDDVRTLVGALAGAPIAPALVELLGRATGGHPLFLHEVLKHLIEEDLLRGSTVETLHVPDGARAVISRRLARLSERARKLLATASALSGGFRWELVREVAGEDEDVLLDALEELLATQLVRETVSGGLAIYDVSHALVAQTLYESLPVPRRARLHAQIGTAIERLYARDLEPHLAALARHFGLAATDDASADRAAEYAVRAGDRATQLVAFEEAARHYKRALELFGDRAPGPRRAELHRARARALAIASAWTEARAEFSAALAAASPDAVEWRVEVLVEQGNAAMWALDIPAVAENAREAESLAAPLGREDLDLSIGAMLAQGLASEGRIDDAIDKYEQVRRRRGDRHVPPLALGPLTMYWNGRVNDACAMANEVLGATRAANDIVGLLIGLPPLGMALTARGQYREAAAVFAEARAIGERHRATSMLARAVSMSTGLHLELGDVDTAEDLATQSRELARSVGWLPGDVSAGIDLVVCHLRRGDVSAAERLLAELTAIADSSAIAAFHAWLWAIRIAWAHAEVAAARGSLDDVERWTAEALRRSGNRRPKYDIAALVTRGRARGAKRRSDALADLDRALAIARKTQHAELFVRAAIPRLALDGDDALAAELAASPPEIPRGLTR
jgi:DNA-binding SARP family transcriptional activator